MQWNAANLDGLQMTRTSPYHYLNLRRNPFGELTRDERAELAIVEVDVLIDFLATGRDVLQVIGPCGHGKTTHLLAIGKAMPTARYLYLPEDGPRPTVDASRPMIVDEAQRMSWWQLRSALRHGGPLILGTHVDLSKQICRAGLRVRTVDVTQPVSILRLAEILNQRIEAGRFNDGKLPQITQEIASRLQQVFGANVRAIERHLYDEFQRSVLEQKTWPPAD